MIMIDDEINQAASARPKATRSLAAAASQDHSVYLKHFSSNRLYSIGRSSKEQLKYPVTN